MFLSKFNANKIITKSKRKKKKTGEIYNHYFLANNQKSIYNKEYIEYIEYIA